MKKVKDLIRKNPEPAGQATYKNPGFQGQVSATSQIAEGALDRYLKSMGIDPRFVSKNTKVSHSKSGHFLKWKRDRQLEDTSSVDVTHPRSRDIQSPTMQRAKAIQKSKSQHQIQPVNSNPTKNPIKSEEVITEVSSSALDRYKEKAKKSADTLSTQGQHKKATDRWMNIMKATGKQIDKTTAGIKKSLSKEDAGVNKEKATKFHAKLDKLVHDTFGKRKNEEVVTEANITHAAHFDDPKTGKWASMALLTAKNDQDAVSQAHDLLRTDAYRHYKLSAVERHEPVKNIKMKEDVEQIDEISKKTLSSYMKKAKDDIHNHAQDAGWRNWNDPVAIKASKKSMQRQAGVKKAGERMAKEDVEQIDEISKGTLHSYATKAHAKYDTLRNKKDSESMAKKNKLAKGIKKANAKINPPVQHKAEPKIDMSSPQAYYASKSAAGQRYTGDSYEPQGQMLDEVSLGDYTTKATQQSKELKQHSKGEYGGIARHLLARREKGLKMAKARLGKTLLEPQELKQSGGSAQTPKLTQESAMFGSIESAKINGLTQVKNIKEFIFDSEDLRYANLMDAMSKLKEDMFDHEKEDKSVASYGKKPKFEKADKDDSKGEKKPEAAAVMSGGTTLTGVKRDTIEIDPMMRARPGQPDPTKKKEGEKDDKKEDKKKDK